MDFYDEIHSHEMLSRWFPLHPSLGAPIARGIHHDCTKFETQISPWVIDQGGWPSLTIVDPRASWLLRNPFSWASSSMAVVFAASTCGCDSQEVGLSWLLYLYIYHEKWRLTYFYENDEQVQTIIECLRGVLGILVVFHENLLFSLAHTPSNAQANLNYSKHMSSHRASTGSTPKVVFSPTILHTCNLNFRKVAKCCTQSIAVISFQHLWVSCRGFVGNFGIYIWVWLAFFQKRIEVFISKQALFEAKFANPMMPWMLWLTHILTSKVSYYMTEVVRQDCGKRRAGYIASIYAKRNKEPCTFM